jgi:biopolymer transport protein ExbB
METDVYHIRFAAFYLLALAVLSATAGLAAQGPPTTGDDTAAVANAAVEAPEETRPQDQAPQGFFQIVFSGGWTGFLIIMLLLALSLTAAYLVFEQIITLRAGELMPEGLAQRVRDLLVVERTVDAEEVCRQRPSFLAFVLLSGLAEVDGGWPAVEKALEDALAEQSARLFRKIEYLSVIANIAPMLGLLGTVTGMIFAFQRVASTQGAAGAGQLAEGIYQALVTTVGGLIVAIPALGAFAILRNRGDQLIAEVAYVAQHAFAPMKRRRGPAAPPMPPTPPPAPS